MLSWAIFVFVLSFSSTPSAVSAHAAALAAAAAGVRAAALLVAGLSGKRSCQAKAVEGLWQRMTKYKITLQPTLSHITLQFYNRYFDSAIFELPKFKISKNNCV